MREDQQPTAHDVEVVRLIKTQPEAVVLTPLQFNGQLRMGLVTLRQNEEGVVFMQLLAILPEVEDQILDALGRDPLLTMTPTSRMS